jgi:hypothetical protein
MFGAELLRAQEIYSKLQQKDVNKTISWCFSKDGL